MDTGAVFISPVFNEYNLRSEWYPCHAITL